MKKWDDPAMRAALESDRTLAEIGQQFGLTGERVRQIAGRYFPAISLQARRASRQRHARERRHEDRAPRAVRVIPARLRAAGLTASFEAGRARPLLKRCLAVNGWQCRCYSIAAPSPTSTGTTRCYYRVARRHRCDFCLVLCGTTVLVVPAAYLPLRAQAYIPDDFQPSDYNEAYLHAVDWRQFIDRWEPLRLRKEEGDRK